MYKLYSICEGELPIYFHMGDDRPEYRFSEADKLIRVLRDFPRLKVIAAHLGGYCAWDKAAELVAAGNDRIMFDTSSALWAMTTERANELVRIIGPERLMFGTDYPVLYAENEIKLFMKLDLTESEREGILYNNAKNFINFRSK
jgi:predicted TIM-barrel fold metal-dependent hydrolase